MRLERVNWIGIAAGVITIIMPFLGPWWGLTFGTGAIDINLSPFGVEASIFGTPFSGGTIGSPLLSWFLLSIKLGIIYIGLVLLTGSVLSVSDDYVANADQLVRFSAKKLLWLVLVFIIVLLIVIVIANQASGIIGSLIGGDIPLQTELPYLIGEGELSTELEFMQFSSPIHMGFTNAFFVAVIAAGLGIASQFYQKRLGDT
ncbi:MAG: hypothetical protein SVM80_02580 [Halobacteriota archaeon]|nr:hypothetical protein [Halobacteriota archaeon]